MIFFLKRKVGCYEKVHFFKCLASENFFSALYSKVEAFANRISLKECFLYAERISFESLISERTKIKLIFKKYDISM